MKNRNGYEDDSDYEDSFHPAETWGATPTYARSCPVTKTLIGATAAIWLLQILLGRFADFDLVQWFGLQPRAVLDRFEVWRLVTMMFLHSRSDFFHVLFNLLALWMFGRAIEHRLGSWRFLGFYVCAGIAASLLYIVVHLVGAQYASAIGASGAAMGILVLFACFYPDAEVLAFLMIPLKAKYLVLILVAIDLLFSVVVPAGQDSGYAHSAHLGGAAFGYLYFRYSDRFGTWLEGWERQREKRDRDRQREEKQELDEILSKISRDGMSALTAREKRFLQHASRRVRDRQS